MSGYKRDIVMRVVPVNGAETIHWFEDRLTDLGQHVRCGVTYPRTMMLREDINRTLRPVVHAKRAQIEIEVMILTMTDQWFLQEIEEALDNPAQYSVFLSLDGGVVEREVVWGGTAGLSATPVRGKTVVGASFVLSLQTKAPVARRGAMMTDPLVGAEAVQDGGIEQWETTAQPFTWSTTGGIITVARESTIVRTGTYSAKITRSDGVTFGQFTQRNAANSIHLLQGRWYKATAAYRSTVDLSVTSGGPFRWNLYNNNTAEFMNSDGKTLGAGPLYPLSASLSASWTVATAYFRIPSTWLSTHDMYARFDGYWSSGESLYYDDVSIVGPSLRPGYATW